jgi:hypothetical protein
VRTEPLVDFQMLVIIKTTLMSLTNILGYAVDSPSLDEVIRRPSEILLCDYITGTSCNAANCSIVSEPVVVVVVDDRNSLSHTKQICLSDRNRWVDACSDGDKPWSN